MSSTAPPKSLKRRPLADFYSERPRKVPCKEDVFLFRVLLPNSTTIELKLREKRAEIPIRELIKEIRDRYEASVRQSKSPESRRIEWDSKDIHLTDADSRIMKLKFYLHDFVPNKWQFLWLHDGSAEADVYEGMWDLTPDTDLLKELPDDYTFETALADLIDNSLQALWSNGKDENRLISLKLSPNRISIFDSGPGMDGSDGNLVKWGKMGASLHREMRGKAVGGKPPYLMPFFGMFGYGGPVATMCLGKRAIVSSKTKKCKKVFTLHLEREALVSASRSENCWRTKGGIRDPTKGEKEDSPHGSFTKVEIFEPYVQSLDIKRFRCKLKDIYFPYIQCDEVSGKTSTPVEFQVNGKDLAEIQGGEVATTNMHSCNGPDFVVELNFSINQDSPSMTGQDQRVFLEANARVKCVYFPMVEGKESIQRILDALDSDGCGIRESFESFCRVSVRRLGRLLPDTRWALLPFMEAKQKKGNKGHTLKRICSRVKCFIDTDAGFNPTPHKTDLAQHHPYTKALKNFGNRAPENEKEVQIKIFRDGKELTISDLEKQYDDWTSQMHGIYDVESDCGVDKPTIVVVSSKIKKLNTTSDVLRVHKKIQRKDQYWAAGQRIKVLKGACPGAHKNNIFATLEYIIFEGLQGDACGEPQLICRPLGVPESKGCHLVINDGDQTIDIGDSLALPIRIIDSEKCTPADNIEWGKKLDAHNQKLPSSIDLLSSIDCQELKIEGAFPTLVQAGDSPPVNIVAVVRPRCFNAGSRSNKLEQKYIVKEKINLTVEIKHQFEKGTEYSHVYSSSISPSTHQGLHGLFLLPLRMKQPRLFHNPGFLTFSFSMVESRDIRLERVVEIQASAKVCRWNVVGYNNDGLYTFRIGSCSKPLSVECYDFLNNRVPFESIPKLSINLSSNGVFLAEALSKKVEITPDKLTMKIKDIVIKCGKLDDLLPTYKATLSISRMDKAFSLSFPCRVIPGSPEKIIVHSPDLRNELVPGQIVEKLSLEVFDQYGNHAKEDDSVSLRVVGFSFRDGSVGTDCLRKVNAEGFVSLGNTLRVSKGYGKDVYFSVMSQEKIIFRQHFLTEVRELRVLTKIFKNYEAGSQLENIVFAITDSEGKIDETIHDKDKHRQPHTLTITSDAFEINDTVRYSFHRGRCTIPSIPLPQREGIFSLSAAHSRYPELNTVVKVNVKNARVEKDMGNLVISNHEQCEYDRVLRQSPSFNAQETRRASSPQVHATNARVENHDSRRNEKEMGILVISNHGLSENDQVLRRSPSLNARETHRASSPQDHVMNAQVENHESRRKEKDMGNLVISNHRLCENDQVLRQSPSLNAQETRKASYPQVHVKNGREENHKSVRNDEDKGTFLFSDRRPRETRGVFSPQENQVHIGNAMDENHRSMSNDEDMGNDVFSNHRQRGDDQFLLPHTPSAKVSGEKPRSFSTPGTKKSVSPPLMTPNMEHADAQIGTSFILRRRASTPQDLEKLSQQELEDDLLKSGMAVNSHHTELERLRNRRNQIDRCIKDLQASMDRRLDDASTSSTCDKELVLKQIKSKNESAACVLCKIPFELWPRDVLGVVALLGAVHSIELSRMLAEYLGEDQMLAIACRNYAAAYHLKANNLRETINRGYHAVCLEDIRPRFMEPSSYPQQLLPLEPPILLDGNVPPGFLDYAVNMMDIVDSHVHWRTESGYGLRETLFYRLFGELQVYKDRESMISAQSCIKDGALSLDGCIIRGNGLVSFGYSEPPDILFPVRRPLSPAALRNKQLLAEKRTELAEIDKLIDEENGALIRSTEKLCMTRDKYNSLSKYESHNSVWWRGKQY